MKRRRTVRDSASIEPPPGYYVAGGGSPDAAQRALILDWIVSRRIASGWRVESRSESQVVLVRGQPVNHVLHAFLTVFSCLVWGIVWAVLALVNRVERVALTVDAQGRVVTVGAP
ncbi:MULTISPECIES: hypothetical protein [Streptomyces]|uniref:DUF8108 domain-containing protein n=1 Tax=Streptomyces griseus subsp. griseus (strain JCM 4626 / CBS 651.72 / NBRC 13350 / KCC S-0626 / ISP 5235) TaxID=455632 RepID=B1VYJ8_STRGG|nr:MULTISPECIES: hypothetical protein [Streptomyces]MYT79903.1 hypothetical protein [Streptomyces sp. SID8364]MBW3707657.1 hypothetical protein [Streptomyces griseus]NEB56941.1 hypothetical protein [Streptomyces griseus]SBV07699.1 hypothetical protein YW3DRAFT_03689 [Streptomyces sp. MnatMP-M77]SEE59192.1 hypothetical protein SAMN04490359_4322 [Streptomyces griseus]